MNDPTPITLQAYLAPNGQWSGIFIERGPELGRVAGCSSLEEVEEAAAEQGYDVQCVELRCPPSTPAQRAAMGPPT